MQECSFFMRTTKTDQTVRMLSWVFGGRTCQMFCKFNHAAIIIIIIIIIITFHVEAHEYERYFKIHFLR